MALSSGIGKNGFTPKQIQTQAQVTLEVIDGKSRITKIHLTTEAVVPDISDEKFQEIAAATKEGCPVSAALASTPITLTARLLAG
jgi:osmotically inducible protein OsmC